MFDKYKTYEILDFINSIIRAGKVEEYTHLYDEAIAELEARSPRMAKIYDLKRVIDIKDKDYYV